LLVNEKLEQKNTLLTILEAGETNSNEYPLYNTSHPMEGHMRYMLKKAFLALAGLSLAAGSYVSAEAVPFRQASPMVNIGYDRGGEIITYALRMKKLERAGSSVRFSGRCDSACTLYLALPSSKACLTHNAAFGFHLPYGASPRGNKVAAQYLLRNYPGWVRNWINANGGLTSGIKTMRYEYASKFIKPCAGGAKTPGLFRSV
jgi:hypothetical protein